jgi:hypothetical protein
MPATPDYPGHWDRRQGTRAPTEAPRWVVVPRLGPPDQPQRETREPALVKSRPAPACWSAAAGAVAHSRGPSPATRVRRLATLSP